jgi:hypothetical protein
VLLFSENRKKIEGTPLVKKKNKCQEEERTSSPQRESPATSNEDLSIETEDEEDKKKKSLPLSSFSLLRTHAFLTTPLPPRHPFGQP